MERTGALSEAHGQQVTWAPKYRSAALMSPAARPYRPPPPRPRLSLTARYQTRPKDHQAMRPPILEDLLLQRTELPQAQDLFLTLGSLLYCTSSCLVQLHVWRPEVRRVPGGCHAVALVHCPGTGHPPPATRHPVRDQYEEAAVAEF